MLELLLIVLFFLSSRFTEYAVLAIIMIYGAWSLYMKTYRSEQWLTIQEAEDERRARFFGAVGRGSVHLGQQISVWRDTVELDRRPALPPIDVRTISPSESGQNAHLVIIEHSGKGGND